MRSCPVLRFVWLVLLCPAALASDDRQHRRACDRCDRRVSSGRDGGGHRSRLQGTRSTMSGREGLYRIPAVPPGQYRIRATLSLFTAVDRTATVLLDATVERRLHPGDGGAGGGRGFERSAPDRRDVDDDGDELHEQRHRPSARLAQLRRHRPSNPAVEPDRGETQGRSLALAIYGATSAENLWIIDGINTTNVLKGIAG